MCNESLFYGPLNDTLSSSEYIVFRATMIIKVKVHSYPCAHHEGDWGRWYDSTHY